MATTTNYSWETPDDTDLVKDGAAAIRTLGSSIDTTTKALNPSTTLGDIEYRSSTANTNTRLAIGTTGQILTVAGGVPSWATLAGTTFSGASVWNVAAVSIPNNTDTTLTFDSEDFDTDAYHSTSSNTGRLTIPAGKSGKYKIDAFGNWATNTSGRRYMYLYKNGSAFAATEIAPPAVAGSLTWSLNMIVNATAADYFELKANQSSGGALDCRVINDGVTTIIVGRYQITYLGA
jgi:hypothetical protein